MNNAHTSRMEEIGRIGGTCPSCGTALAPDDWFCRSCGAVVKRHVGRPRHLRGVVGAGADAVANAGLGVLSRSRLGKHSRSSREHYEPDPAPSPAPKIFASIAAVLIALGIGWWVGGGALPGWVLAPGRGLPVAGGLPSTSDQSSSSSNATGSGTSDSVAVDISGVSYTLVRESLSWDEAKAYCEAHGGTLAQPKTESQLSHVLTLIRKSDAWVFWLGAQRGEAAGETGFVWLDGSVVEPGAFAVGEPNNEGGMEDKLAILKVGKNYAIYDVPRDVRANYPSECIAFVMQQPAA